MKRSPRRTIAMAILHPKTRLLGFAIRMWRSLRRDLFDDYRPERHYMRGPGPRWRAKHPGR
jgi:hypothetical protein